MEGRWLLPTLVVNRFHDGAVPNSRVIEVFFWRPEKAWNAGRASRRKRFQAISASARRF